MAWTEAQYAAYLKRQQRTPTPTPRSQPKAPKHYALLHKSSITLPMLINILGVALQDRFPGVFTPNTALGIHWGNESLRLGVNACGWARGVSREERGWQVVPCSPRDIADNMPTILRRVDALLKGTV